MTAIPPLAAGIDRSAHDQFIVCHGKSGILGVFTATDVMMLSRGDQVVVETGRGMELGSVLGPASLRQARVLGAVSAGKLVRRTDAGDGLSCRENAEREQQIFDAARMHAASLSLEVLDVDLLFDGDHAIVQFVGKDTDTQKLADALQQQFPLSIRLENVAGAKSDEEHGGCDKPDCGRSSAGGCTSCSSGGGCSSCGDAHTDLRPYFSHLRDKMNARIPLA